MRLDFSGVACPIPVIETKKALLAAAVGESFCVVVDNDAARENIKRLLNAMGQSFALDNYEFNFRRANGLKDPFAEQAAEQAAASADAEVSALSATPVAPASAEVSALSATPVEAAASGANSGECLLLKSQKIGEGELGGMLAIGFLTALAERASLRCVVLINDAVFLACDEAHPAAPALRALEQRGVEVICCANCLNYFQLSPKIGRAGDALSIISTLFAGRTLSL